METELLGIYRIMRILRRLIHANCKWAEMMIHRPTLPYLRLLMLLVFGCLAVNSSQARAADFANGLYDIEFRFTGMGQAEALVRIREKTFTIEVVDGKIQGRWLRMGTCWQAHISGNIISDYVRISIFVKCVMWDDRDMRFEGPISDGHFYDEGVSVTYGLSGPFFGTLKMTYLGSQ